MLQINLIFDKISLDKPNNRSIIVFRLRLKHCLTSKHIGVNNMVNIYKLDKTNDNLSYMRLIKSTTYDNMKAMRDYWSTDYYWQML